MASVVSSANSIRSITLEYVDMNPPPNQPYTLSVKDVVAYLPTVKLHRSSAFAISPANVILSIVLEFSSLSNIPPPIQP